MRYILSGIVSLLGIADFILFIQYTTQPAFSTVFWLIHGAIALITGLTMIAVPARYRIWPYYLFLWMPGFGPLGFGFIQFFVIYFEYNQMLLFEYEKYIQFERLFDSGTQSTYTSDIRTISLQDQLLFSQHQSKKDMITGMLSDTKSEYTFLLKQSLDDEDMEITHYAATALNAFEQQFEQQIAEAREQYQERPTAQNLHVLIGQMEAYMTSRLMDSAVQRVFMHDYIDLVKKLIEIDEDNADLEYKIMHSYIELGHLDQAQGALSSFKEKFPDDPRSHLIKYRILFQQRKWSELVELSDQLQQQYTTPPDTIKGLIEFWGREV